MDAAKREKRFAADRMLGRLARMLRLLGYDTLYLPKLDPAALAEIARLSKAGNDKHNPGEPLHWARGKSMDHADCIMRHLVDRGKIDTDGITHTAKVAWRALALLQEELEAAGAPLARGARVA